MGCGAASALPSEEDALIRRGKGCGFVGRSVCKEERGDAGMWWVSGRRGTEENSILGAPMPYDPHVQEDLATEDAGDAGKWMIVEGMFTRAFMCCTMCRGAPCGVVLGRRSLFPIS